MMWCDVMRSDVCRMRERQQQAEERHKAEMQRKMDMLVKLKADISSNKVWCCQLASHLATLSPG